MRRISIFGATGSIGQNTVKLIEKDRESFDVIAVSGGQNIAKLAEIAITLNAKTAVTAHDNLLDDLKDRLKGTGIKAVSGRMALIEAASEPVDWAMSAVVGFAGLELSLAIAQNSKTLALANKESLVCGGALLKQTCQKTGCTLLPVDSEHSAIFQALVGEDIKSVERMILTASGGPFLNMPLADMAHVTPEQAAAHPNWSMGQRISIDSASMFNKAMEVIEAKELFDVSGDQIEVVVHPQSIIHSMVGYKDASIMAQMGVPDMCGAIGYALYWPQRKDAGVKRLDFAQLSQLDFQPVDAERFPAIAIAHDVMRMGGLAGTVFNAAKEQSLDLFLEGKIGFLDMADLVAKTIKASGDHNGFEADSMDKIVKADTWARSHVNELTGYLV